MSSGEHGSEQPPWRAPRRRLPMGRGARLVVRGSTHLVGLGDVSVSGAYLLTRVEMSVGEELELRLLLVPSLTELVLRARVVRVITREQSAHHPQGVAVQFVDVPPQTLVQLDAFVQARSAKLR
jgi:hypothetical protein